MSIEVEIKAQLENAELFRSRLNQFSPVWSEEEEQVDRYFGHPARDFAKTDEAFRIRSNGVRHWFTYKGPKLDQKTKARREIELPIVADESGNAESAVELVEALGFRLSGIVRKVRSQAVAEFQGQSVTVAIDDVERLGPFVELEIVSELEQLERRRTLLLGMAEALGLSRFERRGYIQMLMET